MLGGGNFWSNKSNCENSIAAVCAYLITSESEHMRKWLGFAMRYPEREARHDHYLKEATHGSARMRRLSATRRPSLVVTSRPQGTDILRTLSVPETPIDPVETRARKHRRAARGRLHNWRLRNSILLHAFYSGFQGHGWRGYTMETPSLGFWDTRWRGTHLHSRFLLLLEAKVPVDWQTGLGDVVIRHRRRKPLEACRVPL